MNDTSTYRIIVDMVFGVIDLVGLAQPTTQRLNIRTPMRVVCHLAVLATIPLFESLCNLIIGLSHKIVHLLPESNTQFHIASAGDTDAPILPELDT
jgi:hypothetical protein